MDNLPSKQWFVSMNSNVYNGFDYNEYSEPKYSCEKCGGNVRKNLKVILPSLPPKYEYICESCGNVDYLPF